MNTLMLPGRATRLDHQESVLALQRRTPLSGGKPLSRKAPLRNTSSLRRTGRITSTGEGGDPATRGGKGPGRRTPNTSQATSGPVDNDVTSGRSWVGDAPTARRDQSTVANDAPSLDLSYAARALAHQAVSAAQPRREHQAVPKPEPTKRPTSKGFPPVVRQGIIERDHFKCVRCGINCDTDGWPGYSLQHRDNRGSGGTSDPRINQTGNGALMCGSGTTGCHWWADNHEEESSRLGYVVKSWADPTTVPMYVHGTGWVLVDNNGGRRLTTEPPNGDAHAVAQRKTPWK